MEEVFEFGRRLQADGQYKEAEKCYRRYLEDHADSHKALTNLGVALEAQDKLDDAIAQYTAAVELAPASAIPRYNLGHAFYRQERLDDAATQFSTVLEQHPDHGAARLNLGIIRWRQDNRDQAEAELRSACELGDVAARAHSKLGDLLFERNRYVEARDAYEAAATIEEAPTHYFHAAVCNNLLNNVEAAAAGFARALALDPAARLVHEHRIRALIKLNNEEPILQAFSDWADAVPDDPICEHMRAAYFQDESRDRCSTGYVRDTFSAFAGDFDKTLAKLEYSAPQKVVDALRATLSNGAAFKYVLDAGCGTGLCGPIVRPAANQLIGVDLAPPMLEQARKLGVYDDLIEADLVEYLGDASTVFDAIIASDTFNYFGQLDKLFNACNRSLASGGQLVFTLEQSSAEDFNYRLMPHGRFEHSQKFVQQSLSECGFMANTFDSFVLRKENGENVNGWLIHALKD